MLHLRIIVLIQIFLPLLVSCTSMAQTPFEYRGIYSPTNAVEDIRFKYNTNHVDYDWDLWGHNLKKIVGNKPDVKVYAHISDTLCRSQFCFTSPELYRIIESYILDQYGVGASEYSAKICIMPQDNKMACTCHRCVKIGNREGNATPAVTQMICRLAKRFPHHTFFTSSYHTTSIPPNNILPDNVVAIISAIDLPMRVDFSKTKGYEKFMETVKGWSRVCKKMYVWDYERNFDDYLSPFPCLKAMQARIKLYQKVGIRGVFLNGSGDEYSAFDDMQTVVLAQMLNNPDIDVDKAVEDFFREAYPQTWQLLTDYYLGLERVVVETNHLLPLYGNIEEIIESYLDADKFTTWRRTLDKAAKSTEKPERTRLNYLLTGLSYTQLQIMQLQQDTDADEIEELCAILRGHSELKGMTYFSESYGKIDDYIKKLKNKR